MKNRAGGYRKNLSGEVIYQSFIPSPLPPVPSVKADSEMLSLCAIAAYLILLEENRIEYYDRMSEVRRSGDYEQWIRFFLRAISDCADDAVITVEKLDALHKSNEEKIHTLGRAAKNSLKLLKLLKNALH